MILACTHITELPIGILDSRVIRTAPPPFSPDFPVTAVCHIIMNDSMQHQQEKTKVLEKNSRNATLTITDLTLNGERSNQSLCSERKAAFARRLKTDVPMCVCVCVCVCVCMCVCKSRKLVNRL
jgi:hypothetical protein